MVTKAGRVTAYDRAAFADQLAALGLDLTTATLDKLDLYAKMLVDWQTRMNLVGPATLAQLWQRHMLDSAQLLLVPGLDRSAPWLDIGSGAGFPALVLALLGVSPIHLVEATAKKCRFLAAVAQATDISHRIRLHNARIEELSPLSTAVLTARACAPLVRLLAWGYRHSTPSTRWVLLKGEGVAAEIAAAKVEWSFHVEQHPSLSDPRGVVLELTRVARR